MANIGRQAPSDGPFAWLDATTIPMEEMVLLYGDMCTCCPSLRDDARAALDELGTDAICLISLRALLDPTNVARHRWIHADARLAVFGCEEHDHVADVDVLGGIDSALLLKTETQATHELQIKELLHEVASGYRLEIFAPAPLASAASPDTLSFVNWGAGDVALTSPSMVGVPVDLMHLQGPSSGVIVSASYHDLEGGQTIQQPPLIAPPSDSPSGQGPRSLQSRITAARAAHLAALSPEPEPVSKSYFTRDSRRMEPVGPPSYFTRPPKPASSTSLWKWMFFGLLGVLAAFAFGQWMGKQTKSTGAPDVRPDIRKQATSPANALPRRRVNPPPRPPARPSVRPSARPSARVRVPARPIARRALRPRPVARRKAAPAPLRRPTKRKSSRRLAALLRKSRKVNVGWIGGVCRSGQDCSFPLAMCLPNQVVGFCTRHCSTLCPDRGSASDTTSYCVDSPLVRSKGKESIGLCLPACDFRFFPKSGCRVGTRCQKLRWRRYAKQQKRVCVPVMPG